MIINKTKNNGINIKGPKKINNSSSISPKFRQRNGTIKVAKHRRPIFKVFKMNAINKIKNKAVSSGYLLIKFKMRSLFFIINFVNLI